MFIYKKNNNHPLLHNLSLQKKIFKITLNKDHPQAKG